MSGDPFPGLQPPSPPEELRARVLLAARSADQIETAPLVDRVWESGWTRLAAAVLFVALLALQFRVHSRNAIAKPLSAPRSPDGATLVDGLRIPEDRLSAAEQWDELAPELGMRGNMRNQHGGHE